MQVYLQNLGNDRFVLGASRYIHDTELQGAFKVRMHARRPSCPLAAVPKYLFQQELPIAFRGRKLRLTNLTSPCVSGGGQDVDRCIPGEVEESNARLEGVIVRHRGHRTRTRRQSCRAIHRTELSGLAVVLNPTDRLDVDQGASTPFKKEGSASGKEALGLGGESKNAAPLWRERESMLIPLVLPVDQNRKTRGWMDLGSDLAVPITFV